MISYTVLYIRDAEQILPNNGVENVINVLQDSIRTSFDSGIEESNDLSEVENAMEATTAPDEALPAVQDMADHIASNIVEEVKDLSKEDLHLEETVECEANEKDKEDKDSNETLPQPDDEQHHEPTVDTSKDNTEFKELGNDANEAVECNGEFKINEEKIQNEETNDQAEISSTNIAKQDNANEDCEMPETLTKEDEKDFAIESATPDNETMVTLAPDTTLIDREEKEKEIPRTPHPHSRIETLKRQESGDVTLDSLKPNCSSPHEEKMIDVNEEEDDDIIDDDEGELQKLSWDSDSEERIDLGLEDGTPLKVQVKNDPNLLQ